MIVNNFPHGGGGSNAAGSYYGLCLSTANLEAKKVTVGGDFVKKDGARVSVEFFMGNTAKNMTLNINDTGAGRVVLKSISTPLEDPPDLSKYIGGGVYDFVYMVVSGEGLYVLTEQSVGKFQGTANKGKLLEVASDGFIVPVSVIDGGTF